MSCVVTQEKGLIASSNNHPVLCWFSTHHVYTFSLLITKRNTPYRSLCVFFDFCLCLFRSVPMTQEETSILYSFLEFFIVVTLVDTSISVFKRLFEDVLLYVFKE